jgi:hypothetical protein
MKTKAMIASILMTAAALAASSPAFAADPFLDKELKGSYPGATFKAVHEETSAGTKIQTYEVMEPNKPAEYATATENGDVLAVASPRTPAEMPKAVAEVTTDLFGTPPSKIWQSTVTEYSVSVQTATNKTFVINVNAAGLISNINTVPELAKGDLKLSGKPDATETADLGKLLESRFHGAKVTNIDKSMTSEGFFNVDFTYKGNAGWIVMNKEGRTRAWSVAIPTAEVPKPVLATVAQIKGAKVLSVSRYEYHFWEETMTVSGDTIVVRVRPDGSVIAIESQTEKAMSQAVGAKTGR